MKKVPSSPRANESRRTQVGCVLEALEGRQMFSTWNAAADFIPKVNPNGAWSYGWAQSSTSAFIRDTEPSGTRALNEWQTAPFGTTTVLDSPSAAIVGFTHFPAKSISMATDNRGHYSVIRWTAPASGTYSIATAFVPINPYLKDATVGVRINGRSVFSTMLATAKITASKSLNLMLAKGATVDFLETAAPAFAHDAIVQLKATITSAAPKVATGIFQSSDPISPPGPVHAASEIRAAPAVDPSPTPPTVTHSNANVRDGIPQYVMMAAVNFFPYQDIEFHGGGSVSRTYNPTQWRYGLWGGQGWSDGKVNPTTYDPDGRVVDPMDALFRAHDNAYAAMGKDPKKKLEADQTLLVGLQNLQTVYDASTGEQVYTSFPAGAPRYVTYDFKITILGKTIKSHTYTIPFSEYARIQAIDACATMVAIDEIGQDQKD